MNQAFEELQELLAKRKTLTDQIYLQCEKLVIAVLEGEITEETAIQDIMDTVMEFYEDKRFRLLDSRLCRYVYDHFPQIANTCPNMLRLRFGEGYEALENECSTRI